VAEALVWVLPGAVVGANWIWHFVDSIFGTP